MSVINSRLTKGGGYHPLDIFFPAAPKQKKSDQSQLGYLNYILYGQFYEKKWGYPLQEG